ncbi:hypothetical protein ACOMCU_01215 [Lysinibacillus sp. UGB7]|uniref:hypothetical protein n=1 Tax=Lysinibacillus sp. UGB7 TaxID=3411039 RepID=UPI003B7AFF2F
MLTINQAEHGVIPEYKGFNTKEEAVAYLNGQSITQLFVLDSTRITGEIIKNQIVKGWSDARAYLEGIKLEEHGIQIEFKKFSKRSKALTYILENFPEANKFKNLLVVYRDFIKQDI